MTLYCPHCGQRVLLRLGVHLSPRRADVFDAIKRQSKYGGIRSDALAAMFRGMNCVKVHISHINKALASTGWQIVCEREGSKKGFYQLRRQPCATNSPARSAPQPMSGPPAAAKAASPMTESRSAAR